MTNLDSIFKSRNITLPAKFCLVKAMDFPPCSSWVAGLIPSRGPKTPHASERLSPHKASRESMHRNKRSHVMHQRSACHTQSQSSQINKYFFKIQDAVLSIRASQVPVVVKNPPTNTGDMRDVDSIPGSGRSPVGGHGNSLQYSCLEKPRDRGAWQATVQGIAKRWTELK